VRHALDERHDERNEGVATRIGLEPCAGACERTGEASVRECIGQPLSRGCAGKTGRR
jgi:hypothetical protein